MGRTILPATNTPISYRKLLLFWLPLAAMWLFMGLEQPLSSAFIARLPDAKLNLASFGLALSLTMILQGPVIMMLTVANALAADRSSYRKILHLLHFLALVLTILYLCIGLSPLYYVIIEHIIGAPPAIAQPSRSCFLIMAPGPALIGYRRLWQGVLIRHGKSGAVTMTMIIRIIVVCLVFAGGMLSRRVSGAELGAIALILGFAACALASYVYYRANVKGTLSEPKPNEDRLSWRSLLAFSFPLTLSTLIYMVARPILATGMARSPYPLESLALWPVLQGFLFIFTSVGYSLQEAAIALLKEKGNLPVISRFTWLVACVLLAVYLLLWVTPGVRLWFRGVAGLPRELYVLVRLPVLLMSLAVPATALMALYRAILVVAKRTIELTIAGVVNIALLVLSLIAVVATLVLSGVAAASLAMSIAMCAQCFYLWLRSRKVENRE